MYFNEFKNVFLDFFPLKHILNLINKSTSLGIQASFIESQYGIDLLGNDGQTFSGIKS